MKLRPTHWDQLIFYIQIAKSNGIYYGNKKQFDERHKDLHNWALQRAVQQATKKVEVK